jgi:hypothetical protein
MPSRVMPSPEGKNLTKTVRLLRNFDTGLPNVGLQLRGGTNAAV